MRTATEIWADLRSQRHAILMDNRRALRVRLGEDALRTVRDDAMAHQFVATEPQTETILGIKLDRRPLDDPWGVEVEGSKSGYSLDELKRVAG